MQFHLMPCPLTLTLTLTSELSPFLELTSLLHVSTLSRVSHASAKNTYSWHTLTHVSKTHSSVTSS